MSNIDLPLEDSDEVRQPTSLSSGSLKEVDNVLRFFNLEVNSANREKILKLSQKRG